MMTTQTNPRIKEIQAIWNQYQGLYVVGGILIGLLLFPFLELFISDLSQLLIGLVPEAIGIGFTVFFLDRIYQKREIEALKRRLVREAGSRSNNTAISAIDWLNREGWIEGNKSLLQGTDLRYANLDNANLQGVNLKNAICNNASFRNAILYRCDFENASLSMATFTGNEFFMTNFKDTDLTGATFIECFLTGENFENAEIHAGSFEGAFLQEANFTNAKLYDTCFVHANIKDAVFDGSILPDGTKWTPETDMSRFTDPEHPDFWQPQKQGSDK